MAAESLEFEYSEEESSESVPIEEDEQAQVPAGELAKTDPDLPVFVINVAAQLAGMHPQTLRGYDRQGLVVPRRAKGQGRGRRYSIRDIYKLRRIQSLSKEAGVNLEGIRRILELESQLEDAHRQLVSMTQLVAKLQREERTAPRVFTAGYAGDVHLGRTHRKRRELTR
ncbi:MAG: MerR family transcriptional regulator [Propionibacteriaceae bacterium]|jgi:MerR family transcriptional regulator/heat shock protein HspR|nr:MerR family transcriptional regulator [Propionibacteriaceae bacterium]